MKSLPYQQHSTLGRALGFILFTLALLILAGCNNQQSSAIPTPDLEILAPTATGVTARVEVVIVVVTATPAPAPTAAPTAGETQDAPAATEEAAEEAPEEAAASADAEATEGTEESEESEEAGADGSSGEQTGDAQGQAQAQEMSNQELINMGEEVYANECASCHQLDGEGTDNYPALNQSGLLESDDPTQAIQIVLNGRGEMPGFEDTLSNQQVAAVLSYERNAWQNDHLVVRVAQVRQVRQGGSATTEQTEAADAASTDTASADAESADVESTESEEATPTAAPDEAGEAADTAEPEETAEPDAADEPQETAEPTPEPETAAATDSGQAAQADEALIAQGERVYATECASCHQLHGEGNSTYPALNGSAMLTAEDPTAAINIVLYGQGEMPAFVDLLSAEEIAAVLSHERNAWDNSASVVTVEQVEQVQENGQGAATGDATTEVTGTATITATATVTATTEATGTATVAAGGAAAGADTTPTPAAAATTRGDAGGPAAPLTWTPAREVTPLLPTTSISITATTMTPAPPAAVAVTRTSTVTATTTPAPATAEATPAETTTDEAGEDGEAGEDSEGAAAAGQEELISMGEAVYAEECASCHQNNGEGTSVYPALNGSAMLTAEDPTDAINIVLYGEGEMPAFEEILSTEEIAAVLSHERNAWDNNASVVTVEQVEEVSGN